MSDENTRAEPIGRDSMRVRYLLPVEVDGNRRENHEADVSADDARALVEAGRAEIVGEALDVTDEERKALPALLPPGDQPAEVGEVLERPDDAHPGVQMPGQDVPPALSGPSAALVDHQL